MEQIELEPARHSVPTFFFATPHPPICYEPAVLLLRLLYSRRKKLFGKADDPYVATGHDTGEMARGNAAVGHAMGICFTCGLAALVVSG